MPLREASLTLFSYLHIGIDILLIRQLGKYVSAFEVCGFPLDFSPMPGPVISRGPVDWLQPMQQCLLPPPFRHLIQAITVYLFLTRAWTVMETDGPRERHSSLRVLLAWRPLHILFTVCYSHGTGYEPSNLCAPTGRRAK